MTVASPAVTASSILPPTTDRRPAGPDAPVGAGDRARAAAVARVVARGERAAGLRLDGLRIWALAGGRPAPAPDEGQVDAEAVADEVAPALEAATAPRRRRAQGLHVTPRWLAELLAARALPPASAGEAAGGRWPTVCDPACGGGAVLLAAARHLHRLGVPRRTVVRDLAWGADIDPVGLAAAEAALALWAGEAPPPGRLVVGDPLHAGAEAWPDPPPGGFGAVVGNPPFLCQLDRVTARSAVEQRRLRARYGPAVRAYTDTAWLFLLAGCELVRPGGRVALVQPRSVVAARDAAPVRAAVAQRAVLVDLWIDDRRAFDAAVAVCAPVLERRAAPRPPGGRRDDEAWRRPLADQAAVPVVDLGAGPVLGDLATVVAGFRDEYYGLVAAVREHDDGAGGGDMPGGLAAPARLVTSGALDWGGTSWGERPVRFAKRRWQAPVVDPRLLAEAPAAARRWVERTRGPKLVVASQTRVVEAAVDERGSWVPSVPALAVVPADRADLWLLAAAVLAPAATAWLARRSAGTALDRHGLKVSGPDLAALPLPGRPEAWRRAAEELRAFAARPSAAALDRYLAAAAAAYGVDEAVAAWWRDRAGASVRIRAADG